MVVKNVDIVNSNSAISFIEKFGFASSLKINFLKIYFSEVSNWNQTCLEINFGIFMKMLLS